MAKIIENKELKKGFKAWFWRKLLILNLILSLVALYYTMSRAALVSLAFGLFVFVLLFTKKVGKKISFAFMVLLPVMLLIGLLFVNVFSENPVVKNNQILNRFVFSGESLRSAEARFVVWPEVVKTIAARPILGYGPDSFGLAFQAYFPAELNNLEKLGDTSDRAHNFILDFAVQYGIAGLIYFLAFLFFVLRRLFSYLKTENENDWLYVIAIFCSLTAAFVAVMFGFFVTTNLVYITMFLAILLTFTLRNKLVLEEDKLTKKIKSQWKNIIKNTLNMIVFAVFCFGVTVVIFIPNFNLLKADYDFRFFLNNQREHQADAINHATQAANEGNNFAFYSYEFDGYLAKNPNANYVKQALELIEHAGERNNFDAFYHYRKAEMEALAEQNDGAVFDFKEAINKMPNYAPFYFDYGKLLVQLGEKENDLVKKKNVFDEALNVLNKYLELSPKYWQWKNNLAARSPEDRDQYRIFYKLNPNFDEVFDLIKMAGH